eukprot:2305480-Prymnesium_polylepis.1
MLSPGRTSSPPPTAWGSAVLAQQQRAVSPATFDHDDSPRAPPPPTLNPTKRTPSPRAHQLDPTRPLRDGRALPLLRVYWRESVSAHL